MVAAFEKRCLMEGVSRAFLLHHFPEWRQQPRQDAQRSHDIAQDRVGFAIRVLTCTSLT
jgi:hypothetical protein